jgi:two-component system NtrC family sensor kinase
MSIRTVLVAGMLAVALVPALLVGALGVHAISTAVRNEAQARVNHDLDVVVAAYREKLAQVARRVEEATRKVGQAQGGHSELLAALRRELDLTVLNLCDVGGRPIAGSYPSSQALIPVSRDPVLRQALEGRVAWSTVLLEADRQHLEGGPAFQNAAAVYSTDGGPEPASRSALLWWVACPIIEETGRVTALLYGGRLLNFHHALVDSLRSMVCSEADYQGKPRGTVTLFARDVRVATNVLDPGGGRAVGTRVSAVVRQAVMERGEPYTGEALVVDAWYLSGYAPLRDLEGRTVGMVYVGLLRAPYDAMRNALLSRFLLPVAGVGLLAVAAALLIVQRLIRPVRILGQSAGRLAQGDWGQAIAIPHTYAEIRQLGEAFEEMRGAVVKRDQELRARNEDLSQSNAELALANRNYMQTLGFVTHELKAPLAAIQMLIATVVEGYCGQVPAAVSDLLTRIQRNCEELQDMVRDYLDLSRLERGDLKARTFLTNLPKTVLAPAVDQTAVFFRSRKIEVEVQCPPDLTVLADPELLRIALNNLLTNAAKYGREGGKASVSLRTEGSQITLSVWNEGEGFPPEEALRLFDKFFRLKTANTYAKRGSGLGLFTVRHIAELHGGRVWAESEPGAWAAFHLNFPKQETEVA